jgi:A/G-specific adenine glycosylase
VTAKDHIARIGAIVLAWGAREARDLPWRATRDPWAVLVSEVMLQQTQVSRVLPKYSAFLDRFPTPQACAQALQAEIVRSWSGMGYNSRAMRLHQAAGAIVERHGGTIPNSLDDLLNLPGVGPYTARAVMAFAFEADVGVVDTNVARVLSRSATGRPMAARELQSVADEMVPPGRAWLFNQAMLDLGSAHCTSQRPRCERCPVRRVCCWAQVGWRPPDPARATAGTARQQSTFAGSDRQGRGRLVDAARLGPIARDQLPLITGWTGDPERAVRVAVDLESDGILARDGESSWRLA